MKNNQYITIDAHLYSEGKFSCIKVQIAVEYNINIFINTAQYSTMACSSSDLEFLLTGHLFNEGIIKSRNDITEFIMDEQSRTCNINIKNTLPDDFNAMKIFSAGSIRKRQLKQEEIIRRKPVNVKAAIILERMNSFLNTSQLHEITHGVHSAGLYSIDGEELIFIDDIGRHNAIDKITGFALKKNINLNDKMIFLTGRLASEIVNKILRSPMPILVSRAFPTDISFNLAKKYNLTMIGKAEKNQFYVFNGIENILV
jgi:FdhD protein